MVDFSNNTKKWITQIIFITTHLWHNYFPCVDHAALRGSHKTRKDVKKVLFYLMKNSSDTHAVSNEVQVEVSAGGEGGEREVSMWGEPDAEGLSPASDRGLAGRHVVSAQPKGQSLRCHRSQLHTVSDNLYGSKQLSGFKLGLEAHIKQVGWLEASTLWPQSYLSYWIHPHGGYIRNTLTAAQCLIALPLGSEWAERASAGGAKLALWHYWCSQVRDPCSSLVTIMSLATMVMSRLPPHTPFPMSTCTDNVLDTRHILPDSRPDSFSCSESPDFWLDADASSQHKHTPWFFMKGQSAEFHLCRVFVCVDCVNLHFFFISLSFLILHVHPDSFDLHDPWQPQYITRNKQTNSVLHKNFCPAK